MKKEEEGVVYKIKCKECEKVYIGETKFNVTTKINIHKNDVEHQ